MPNLPTDDDVYIIGDVDIADEGIEPRRSERGRPSVVPWLLSFLILGAGVALFWLYVVPLQTELDEKSAAVARAEADVATLRGVFETTSRERDALVGERDRLTADVEQRGAALAEAQRAIDELTKKLDEASAPPPPCPTASTPSKTIKPTKPSGGGKR